MRRCRLRLTTAWITMNRHSSRAMMMRVHQAESVPWKVMKV